MSRSIGLLLLPCIGLAAPCTAVQLSIPALTPMFGYSITGSETTLVISDPGAADGRGMLWVYTQLPQGTWSISSTLEGKPGDSLGYSLDIDGSLLIAGAPGNRTAYIYDLTTGQISSAVDSLQKNLDGFGRAVTIHGVFAAIGSPTSHTGDGQVDLFIRGLQDQWSWTQSLAAMSEAETFGQVLTMDSEILLIGAPAAYEPRGQKAGLSYIYQRTSGSGWVLQAELRGGSAGYEHRFGSSLALDTYNNRRRAMIGAPGDSRVYLFSQDLDDWSQADSFTPVPAANLVRTGVSVALFNTHVIVGAPAAPTGQNGRVWILTLDELGTILDQTHLEGTSRFGHAVASWDDHYAISEPGTAVHIFSKTASVSIQAPTHPIAFDAYPNPFRDSVLLTGLRDAPDQLFIFDASGRLLQTLSRNGQPQLHWTPQALASGVYILRSGRTVKPLIKLP